MKHPNHPKCNFYVTEGRKNSETEEGKFQEGSTERDDLKRGKKHDETVQKSALNALRHRAAGLRCDDRIRGRGGRDAG